MAGWQSIAATFNPAHPPTLLKILGRIQFQVFVKGLAPQMLPFEILEM